MSPLILLLLLKHNAKKKMNRQEWREWNCKILSHLDMKERRTNNGRIDVARFFLCCIGKVIITEKVQLKHTTIKC